MVLHPVHLQLRTERQLHPCRHVQEGHCLLCLPQWHLLLLLLPWTLLFQRCTSVPANHHAENNNKKNNKENHHKKNHHKENHDKKNHT